MVGVFVRYGTTPDPHVHSPVLNGEEGGRWAEGGMFIVRCGRTCCLVMDVMAAADVVIMQNF